ncbi:scavenger receptor class F member 2-like [Haliotis rubra]|uniref:scavenger receptor class F member 2-like n=1 Tax=Haliotis rubra TaxID=36100 RepID=UPI001EE56BAD|nr:scavenger receptor class F member 2-like [Haliotis rubra]
MRDLQKSVMKNLEMLSYTLMFLIFAIQGKGEECPLGTYGETCDRNCSPHCAPSPSDKNVHCDKLTGMCSEGCNRGWHGDQCNFRCSRNCFNYVCEVQRGTCVGCKTNYSGDYCEMYEGSCQKKCEDLTAPQNASAPVSMILVPVFVVVAVILVIIIIILIVHTCRRGRGWIIKGRRMGSDDARGQHQNLLADGGKNTGRKSLS